MIEISFRQKGTKMKKYINKIDENLVREVVGNFLLREWNSHAFLVRKKSEGFKVVYKIGESYCSLVVRDFDMDFGTRLIQCPSLNRKWRIALTKKFGDRYLFDLKKYLYKDFDKKSEKEQKEIVGELTVIRAQSSKNIHFKDITKEKE